MAQTFGEMKTEAGRLSGYQTPDAFTLYGDSINRRYRDILTRHSWPDLDTDLTVTVSAGENSVGIPIEGGLIRSIYNTTASQFMERVDPVEMDQRFGEQVDDSDSLRYYAVHGNRGAFKEMAAGTISVASTAAADAVAVRVRGFDGAGFPFDLEGNVNGTNSVGILDSTMTVAGSKVMEFTKAADTAGNILLYSNATLISKIGPNERSARYNWIRFLSSASTDTVLRVNLKVFPTEFDDDKDVPVLRGIEHILIVGATADGYRKLQQFSKALAEEVRYEQLLENYMEMHVSETEVAIQSSGSMHEYRRM